MVLSLETEALRADPLKEVGEYAVAHPKEATKAANESFMV